MEQEDKEAYVLGKRDIIRRGRQVYQFIRIDQFYGDEGKKCAALRLYSFA